MKTFLTSKDLSILGSGYLATAEKKPVYNEAFCNAQKHAEFVITFAEKAKGKDFVGKEKDSLEDFKRELAQHFADADKTTFVEVPKAVKGEITQKLAKEAMAFADSEEKAYTSEKVNNFMQQFIAIKEFEDFGLFFEEEVCKMNKIYTIAEIQNAVVAVISLLD